MKHRIVVLGAAVMMTIGLAVTPLVTAQSRVELFPSGEVLYARLVDAASKGDAAAAKAVADIDRYARDHDLRVADMPVPDDIARVVEEWGGLVLEVRDAGPWFISIYNRTSIDTADGLAAYRAARHAGLAELAESGDRMIEVTVTPARFLSFEDLGAIVHGKVRRAAADVFVGDSWIMTAGANTETAASWEDIERGVRGIAEGSLDQYENISPTDLRITVRSIGLELTSREALRLAENPSILLVDSETDIADAFAMRAAVVWVGNPPDVFRVHAAAVLGVELVPTDIEPVKKPVMTPEAGSGAGANWAPWTP